MKEDLTDEKNLATIRGLVERAAIYRAIFTRTAFISGALSILTAGAIFVNDELTQFLDRPVRAREFAFAWADVFFLTLVVNIFFLWRAARGNADSFGSARMKLVWRTIVPVLLIPAGFTAWFFGTGYLGGAELDLIVVWIVFYGLTLLSTAFFAPRSIALLGWAFLLTGLSVPVLADKIENWVGSVPTVLMGVTFGLYQLVFAAVTWLRERQEA
jgi:hypothetical protein